MAELLMIYPSNLISMDCRLQYHWSRSYRPRTSATHLEFGSAVHYALEQYYGSKENPAEAFTRYMIDRDLGINTSPYGSPDLNLGVAMLTNYLKQYNDLETFTILFTEKEVARRIPIPEDEPDPPARAKRFYVAARIDAVVWDRALAKAFVMEHKTFETFYPGSLELDHQFVIEKFVAGGLTTAEVAGVIYNGLRKRAEPSKTTKLFERHTLYINDRQVKVALHRAYWSLKEATSDNFIIYPEPAAMKCNMCAFKRPCVEYMRGGDYQFLLDNLFAKREEEDTEWEI